MSALTPQPKPARTPGVERLQQRRVRRRSHLRRASERKRRTMYGGSDWPEARAACLRRDGWRCLICQRPAATAHHLVSVGAGGKNDLNNLFSVCQLCHARIHDGHVARQRLYDLLTERYAYDYSDRSND